MKQILTLIAATFFFTAVNASEITDKTPASNTVNKNALTVTLQAAGRVSIAWTAVADESTTTVYEIQKSVNGAAFKTVAILMGEKLPAYAFRDKLNGKGNIEYRIVTSDNNIVRNTVSQDLIVL